MSIDTNAPETPFSTLQTMVLEVFKRDDKTTELKRAINEAYREMVACVDPRKLKDQIYKPCVVGREEYAIPDSVLRINHPIRIIDTTATNNSASSYPLEFLLKDEYDEIEPNPNTSLTVQGGKPEAYCFFKNSILLTPIPDSTNYTIEINIGGEPTELSADADTTIFRPMWDETLKAGALSRLFAGIEAWTLADKWQIVYRYGFAGNEGNITGGLGLLKKLNHSLEDAPIVVKSRDF